MKHSNAALFIPHKGCPNSCSFCDQRTISGKVKSPTPREAEEIIRSAYDNLINAHRLEGAQIAFFGGSFTAIDRRYMTELLDMAVKYTGEGKFSGIRISTRPDCIDSEILALLKSKNVTAIELGAQSMSEDVLAANDRGHTANDVRTAARLIKEQDFELGLQMMTGLYRSSEADDLYTGEELIKLHPDTVRIYPTVILRGTKLAELYESGEYSPYSFDKCVQVCAALWRRFTEEKIKVIRLGLHAEESLSENMIAGFFHPALGEIVRSRVVRDIIEENLAEGVNVCEVSPRRASVLAGHGGANRCYFDRHYPHRTVFRQNDSLPPGVIAINGRHFRYEI